MLIVEMTPKRVSICPGCKFAIETEDGRVYCGNKKCIWYLQTTTCKCERPTVLKAKDSPASAGEGANSETGV